MRSSHVLLAVSAACLAAFPIAAQTCIGAPSFANGRWAGVGSVTTGNDASELGATLRYGKANAMFAGASLRNVNFDGTDENSFAFGAHIGHELHQVARPTVSICPMASLARGIGPDFGATEVTTVSLTGGASAGVTLAMGQDFAGLPFIGAHFVHLRATEETLGVTATNTENYLTVNAGFGLVINGAFGMIPSVQLPIGLDGADATFTLAVQFNFGRR